MSSPTSRSLDYARKQGWMAGVVERHNTFSHKKNDLFGFADIAIAAGRPLLVQACAGSSHAARRTKLLGERLAQVGLAIASGYHVEIWSWSKTGARGKRKLWTLRVEKIGAEEVRAAARCAV
jgi:hypothetical protein